MENLLNHPYLDDILLQFDYFRKEKKKKNKIKNKNKEEKRAGRE
jgi:hypothetical protein